MSEYKIIKPASSVEAHGTIVRFDNEHIPYDINNSDYKNYLLWVEAGNVAPIVTPDGVL